MEKEGIAGDKDNFFLIIGLFFKYFTHNLLH